MGEKSFIKPIDEAGIARLRMRIRTHRGRVVEVVIQLEVELEGQWRAVVRYDNAHDFPHRDVLDPHGKLVEKTPLGLASLEEFLEYAEVDLVDRWEWYVERFMRMRRPQ